MRLYMPVPHLRRCLAKDEKFGEYDIPQGSIVYVSFLMIKIKFHIYMYSRLFIKHYKVGKMTIDNNWS